MTPVKALVSGEGVEDLGDTKAPVLNDPPCLIYSLIEIGLDEKIKNIYKDKVKHNE